MIRKSIVCFSGGADSTTVLYLAMRESEKICAFSVDYGQRHSKELECARDITARLGIQHVVMNLNLGVFGGSPLVDKTINVPDQQENAQSSTVVPYRNTLIATLAAALARSKGYNTIYMGPTYEDLANYADCRPIFYESLEETLRLGDTLHDLSIITPFISSTKREIVRFGMNLGVDYSKTWTCYAGLSEPCMKCDSCRERMLSFRQNDMKDPLISDEKWADYLKEKI